MEAPRLPSIFKHRGAKKFDFKPRFYDERKERINELKKKYQSKDLDSRTYLEADLRERISSEWRNERQKSTSSSNFRLVAIIAILFFIAYLIISKF